MFFDFLYAAWRQRLEQNFAGLVRAAFRYRPHLWHLGVNKLP